MEFKDHPIHILIRMIANQMPVGRWHNFSVNIKNLGENAHHFEELRIVDIEERTLEEKE